MRLSTTSSIMGGRTEGGHYSIFECFDALKAAGYEYVDVSLWQQSGHGMPLDRDDWREWCAKVKEYAQSTGLGIYQTHGSTLSGMHWDELDYPERDFVFSMNYRCIEATALIGGKCMVMHPYNLPHEPLYDREKLKAACIEHFAPYIEHAKKFGVKIAIENMVDFKGVRRRYCAGDIYELIELVDTINDPDVGICLDTGHANEGGADNAAAIRLIGKKRLFATHINDNHKVSDEHILPFFGDIKWLSVMDALKDIGYSEDFSFEVGSKKLPDFLRAAYLKYTYEVGKGLIDYANRQL